MSASRNERRLARKQNQVKPHTTHRVRKWPEFRIDAEDGDPQFVEAIKNAIYAFRFEELPLGQQLAFRMVAKDGADATLRALQEAAKRASQKDPTSDTARFLVLDWELALGELIFAKIPESVRQQLLPYSDARFLPVGNDIIVLCRSLLKKVCGNKPLWSSRLKPTVQLGGKSYTVAYSDHAIEQIKNRLNPDWITYAALGDVYAYLERCARFDVCYLRNRSRDRLAAGTQQLAVTFFDYCDDPRFWQWMYVKKVLGLEKLNSSLGKSYYRVGYCPAFIHEDGGLLELRTFLYPGYTATPESALLASSSLPLQEKARLRSLASQHARNTLLRDQDFSAIKWFHENGVPQIIQSTDPIYHPVIERGYTTSYAIRK